MLLSLKKIINTRVVQHVLFWSFYVLIYYFNYRINEPALNGVLVTLLYLPGHLFFTYTQLYFLIPRFLLRRKKMLYIILTALFLKAAINIHWLFFTFAVTPFRTGSLKNFIDWGNLWQFKTYHFLPFFALIAICGLAVSIKLLKKWYLENERKMEAEKEKTIIELEMLKAQVHPHFLFNTLNNIYSLTLTKSDIAPIVVTHLSDLLRYMLYECNEKEVPLTKEIEMLQKYLELEKLRYGNRIDISFKSSGTTNDLKIAPLLLLPFVENSFKHGVSEQLEQCWINLNIHASENKLSFHLSNSNGGVGITEKGGIGLQNIRKRLGLLYADKYNLVIKEDEDMYLVKLELELSVAQPEQQPAYTVNLQPQPAL